MSEVMSVGRKRSKISTAGQPVDSKGWKMMKVMGYEHGQGLGADSQGRVQTIPVEMRKGRGGLGLNISRSVIDFCAGPHAWHECVKEGGVDGDRVWNWSRWPKHSQDGDTQNSLEEYDVETLECKAFRAFDAIFISPSSPTALGPPVTKMESQTNFCDDSLLLELLSYKNSLEDLSRLSVINARMRSNQYEEIKKGIFMNRAAMKMANMDCLLNNLITGTPAQNEVLHFADICAGPGGFSEYVLWRRCNALDCLPDTTKLTPVLNVRGYGMTLTGDCDFKVNEFIAGPLQAFMPFYGAKKNGDVTDWVNLASFSKFVAKCTDQKGVHLVMADGGFDVSGQNNLQEVLSKRIYLCQCLCALTVLRPGGNFVTKLFDIFTDFSADLVYLMSHVFKQISIIKPVTSRPANSERYLLCRDLISTRGRMAGCPPAPEAPQTAAKPSTDQNNSAARYKSTQKRPGSGRRQNLQNNPASSAFQDADHCDHGDYFDPDLAVGKLIQHLLDVNERLGMPSSAEISSATGVTDVLHLCQPHSVSEDRSFFEFLSRSNNEIAETQCVNISKLLQFASNPTMHDDATQRDIKNACLAKWRIPNTERLKIPWPLWPSNYVDLLHNIMGDSSKSLPWLPPSLKRPANIPLFINEDFLRHKFAPDALIGLPCGLPSRSEDEIFSPPITVYSRNAVSEIEFTYDGQVWNKLLEKYKLLDPRLPPGSLVWAQATREYDASTGLRRNSLTILDVACLYGRDLRSLSYRQRMEHARGLADVVNFPSRDGSNIIVPPLISLRDLTTFIERLPKWLCKDPNPSGVALPTKTGLCIPNTLYVVNHLAAPWIELKSRETDRFYFYNRTSNFSVYEQPSDSITSYEKTTFFKVPWKANEESEFSVTKLASDVIGLDF